ncbi:GntR family transcriptional regulator [Melghirimyces profundicolus]|uniref:GntR family transcriptional regulator n=1 Tax=Melghirimyces profundicolus TaxID=1242148 RepID=A0A2T6BR37_9BACL|nr:GntR family transcriptional regulator [Melghirimyces profundicolus]PTX58504.1 GntR family transcriptional regulator [Melghirimyces profundicolus]
MDAYQTIKESIIIGKYRPGMRLTEEFLAGELNVSRTPIREVLKQLESEGLLTPLRRGMIVRSFSKEDIRQIYDLRTLLEGYAAGQAALFRTPTDLQQMREANRLYEQVMDQKDPEEISSILKIVRANQHFHEAIHVASHNEHLRFHISKVVVLPLVFQSFYWYDRLERIRSLESHQTILEAIENRDSERARIAMHEHIYQGRDKVLKHLDELSMEDLKEGKND